jgi:hypothetical protein
LWNERGSLIDAAPIKNFILSVLHNIIDIGNILSDGFFKWIEWRVEQLTQEEVVHRNTVVYAKLKVVHVKEAYDRLLEDEGVLLANKISEKKRLSKDYHAKVLC